MIGSVARGQARPGSDLDVALWLSPLLGPAAALAVAAGVQRDAQEAIGCVARVDVVDLRRAPPVVQHRALRDAVVLVERDRDQRVRYERDALVRYWDTAPLRAMQRTALRARIAEDRFGRP